jgi:hypothetical protein
VSAQVQHGFQQYALIFQREAENGITWGADRISHLPRLVVVVKTPTPRSRFCSSANGTPAALLLHLLVSGCSPVAISRSFVLDWHTKTAFGKLRSHQVLSLSISAQQQPSLSFPSERLVLLPLKFHSTDIGHEHCSRLVQDLAWRRSMNGALTTSPPSPYCVQGRRPSLP